MGLYVLPGGGGIDLCPQLMLRQGFPAGFRRGTGRPGRGYAAAPGAQPQRGHRHQAAPGRRAGGGGVRRPHPLAGGLDRLYPGELVLSPQRRGYLSPAAASHHPAQRRSGGAGDAPPPGAGYLRALRQNSSRRGSAQHRHQDPAHRQGVRAGPVRLFHRGISDYSPLADQVCTIRAFDRPVILVDDMLHDGKRIRRLARCCGRPIPRWIRCWWAILPAWAGT